MGGCAAHFFYKVFYPAIWALNQVANWVLRIIGLEPVSEAELGHSEEELRLLLSASGQAASDHSLGRAIAQKAFSLKDLRARNIMLPRNKIVALFAGRPESSLKVAEASRHNGFLCVGKQSIKSSEWFM